MYKLLRPGKYREYNGRLYSVFVEVEYDERRGKLSLTGVMGPKPDGNAMGGCGQCDDGLKEIEEYAPGWSAASVAKLHDIWDRWHLNDMHAGCEHQRALGWDTQKLDEEKEVGWHVDLRTANLAHWLRYEEGGPGLLGKPCPVCGYRYGSAWLHEAVPDDVLTWLFDETPAGDKPLPGSWGIRK